MIILYMNRDRTKKKDNTYERIVYIIVCIYIYFYTKNFLSGFFPVFIEEYRKIILLSNYVKMYIMLV